MLKRNKTLIIINILIIMISFIVEELFPALRNHKTIEYTIMIIICTIIGLNIKDRDECKIKNINETTNDINNINKSIEDLKVKYDVELKSLELKKQQLEEIKELNIKHNKEIEEVKKKYSKEAKL